MVFEKVCLAEFHRPDMKIPTFSELIGSLITSLTKLGVNASYSQNKIEAPGINIIFGSHRIIQSFENVGPIPGNCIVFNLEPLNPTSDDPLHLKYLNLLKQSIVIDYSDKNCKILNQAGNDKVFRFKFGHTSLTPFKFPARGNHLLFYGEPTRRRRTVIETLLNNKISLFGIVDYWGFERDYEISTARAVLNISRNESTILEVYRLWHSLCLGTPVISEKGSDPVLVDEWINYVGFVDNLLQVSGETANSLPSPDHYKAQTSFHSEVVRLRNWILNL